MHLQYVGCVYRGDFKVKTALKVKSTSIVVIPNIPWGKINIIHDENSWKKSLCLVKVHLYTFTLPRSALYQVASYHHREMVAVQAIQPCSHTIIQLYELTLGLWPVVTVALIIFMSQLPLLQFRCSRCGHLLALGYGHTLVFILIFSLCSYNRLPYNQIDWHITEN